MKIILKFLFKYLFKKSIIETKRVMDYKNGKIYKILNTITDDVYVGSTCQPLSKRMAKHRETINTRKGHTLLYTKMKELGV